ncbi:MAG: mechanosensitive ion channel, partial [Emcibacteraceae bacterium]|nr:mechanosensitive ion channel [Emcibacteraceae bacterium]
MINWLIKAMHGLFIFLGVASILEIWGIQVAPLIAGLGLFGVAVALGAQDLFKNLISGLFIIGERRFHPGDWVKVDGIV